jgi:isopenicillin-N epimerase
MERRKFFKQLGAGLTATAAAPLISSAGLVKDSSFLRPGELAARRDPSNESYWEMVKKQFAIQPGLLMVNAANLCPAPHFVNERVSGYSKNLSGDVSFQNRAKFSEERKKAIGRLARYLNVSGDEIAITRNTSESNNIVVNGLDFSGADEVIVWEQNHPSNNVAWEQRARRFGFRIRKIGLPAKPHSKEALLQAFSTHIHDRTRLIAFSHISNVSGLALPAKEICHLARERNILTLIDGAQAFGFMDLDLRDLGCDFYTGSTHKWLMGPMENGLLYVRKEQIAGLWPNIIAAGWKEENQTLDEKVAALGQRNTPSTPAINDILDFHEAIGKTTIEARVRRLNAYLKERIQKQLPQAEFVTPLAPAFSAGITIFNFPGKEPAELFQQLYEKYGIAAAPTGGVRLSPHIYCTLKDMDKIVEALAALAG